MDERFEQILAIALRNKCTDIHFTISEFDLSIALRGYSGLKKIKSEADDEKLFNYLMYLAHLDMTNSTKPQSGAFEYYFKGNYYDFRFAVLTTNKMRSGVLRILNHAEGLKLEQLTFVPEDQQLLASFIKKRTGMVIFAGLTGSGKTTTMYSLLRMVKNKTIYSLEDPIEIIQDNIVQLAINEKTGFGYDEGIKQVLRHNPDILMIGEIRDEYCAKMAFRASLTGCLVFTSLHARNSEGAINRLLELGVNRQDILQCLDAICYQRLVKLKGVKQYTCLYDIITAQKIKQLLDGESRRDLLDEKYAEYCQQGVLEDDE